MTERTIDRYSEQLIKSRYEGVNYYLSFFIWPFGVMLAALRHWERPWSKNVFWLFCAFFGLTFIIAGVGGADSERYAQLFIQYAYSDINLKELWRSFYTESSNYVDIASPLITYIVSRFTSNPQALFLVFGIIFGYFYSRNIWFILNKIQGKHSFILLVLIISFVFINPIWNINGFRMWAASQIFVFGALPYLFNKNSRGLIWTLVSVFFHYALLIPCGILFLYILIKNRINIYFVFFIITSFIKELDLGAVQSTLSFLPNIFMDRVSGYTNLDYAETIILSEQSLNWYIQFYFNSIIWVNYILASYIYFFGRKHLSVKKEFLVLFSFSLLLYGFSNIISLIPSGGRYHIIANTFMFSFYIVFFSEFPNFRALYRVAYFTLPILLPHLIITLRIGMDYFGLMTIFGNPVVALINKDIVPLIDGIKQLIL